MMYVMASVCACVCLCECVPCRWRRRVVERQPTPLAGNLQGSQSFFGHFIGFSLDQNVVGIGGLDDGVVLHHTVDT